MKPMLNQNKVGRVTISISVSSSSTDMHESILLEGAGGHFQTQAEGHVQTQSIRESILTGRKTTLGICSFSTPCPFQMGSLMNLGAARQCHTTLVMAWLVSVAHVYCKVHIQPYSPYKCQSHTASGWDGAATKVAHLGRWP